MALVYALSRIQNRHISCYGTVFYVAIPAQTYHDLKIELSSDGENFTKSITTKADADIVVARNKIYPINQI